MYKTITQNNLPSPLIIGHRGACGYAPENTLASFQKALELCCEWVEFDVMLTRDFIPVLLHDTTIDRTTTGRGEIIQYSFDQLQVFDAGSWFHPSFCKERVPKLVEVLKFLRKHAMKAVVEIKPFPGYEKLTVEKTMKVLQSLWPDFHEHIIVASFEADILACVKNFDPKTKLGLGIDEWDTDPLALGQELNCYSLHINEAIVDAPDFAKAKAHAFKIFAYTVNENKRARELLNLSIDGIFSDYPDKIL